MALNDQTTYDEYTHNGVATDYTITFMSYDTAPPYGDIKVFSIDGSDVYTEIFVGTDFTFETTMGGRQLPTGVLIPDTIRLNTAGEVPTGDKIRIVRDTETTQENTVADKTVETSLDKITAKLQEIEVNVGSGESLQSQIDDNKADIATLDSNLDTTILVVDALNTRIGVNEGDIAALQAGKADITVTDGLDAAITQNELDIADNAALASAAMAKANNNETDIAAINLDTAQITLNKNDIAAQDVRITQNESDITGHDATLVNHEGRILTLENNLLDAVINGTMDIVNNVTVPANVTYEDPSNVGSRLDLKYDADETASVEIKFAIARSTDDDDQPASGTLYMVYRAPNWFIDYGYLYGWNPDIDFSVTTDPVTKVGTVKYISSDFTGANYASTLRFSAKQIGIGV